MTFHPNHLPLALPFIQPFDILGIVFASLLPDSAKARPQVTAQISWIKR